MEAEIDPTWWECLYGADGLDAFATPESFSLRLQAHAWEGDVGGLQRQVVDAMVIATSALLQPESWLEPFTPWAAFDGRRSPLPEDLTTEQVALLARIAPMVMQTPLRARIADVAWFAGDRGDLPLLRTAIDAYRALPLSCGAWFDGSSDGWRRAFEIVQRRGNGERERKANMLQTLRDWISEADRSGDDAAVAAELSEVLLQFSQFGKNEQLELAERFVELAASMEKDLGVRRRLEVQARSWFNKAGDQSKALDCVERIAKTYVAEADARGEDPTGGALVAGLFIEDAIATLREIPRSVRLERGIDKRIRELRIRLGESRESSIESMTRFESDPVDLTQYRDHAIERVSGESLVGALLELSVICPSSTGDTVVKSATERVNGSVFASLAKSVVISTDGRKVAGQAGTSRVAEPEVWREVRRHYEINAGVMAVGMVLPAVEAINLEHRIDRKAVGSLLADSPVVPNSHVNSWASGLVCGFELDMAPAVAVLLPQLEQAIRILLKRNGVHTQIVDEDGVETEKGLGALLDMPEAEVALGSGMTMEMQALFTDPAGPNHRNDVAHGLMDDASAWSHVSVYSWWMCLRFALAPLRIMLVEQENRPASDEVS